MSDFKIRYPGVYDQREKPWIEQYTEETRRINERGPIDVQALISGKLPPDTPGVGPVLHATEEMVRYYATHYNPFDPMYNDKAYAQAHGHPDIPAISSFAGHDDTYIFPIPHEARDMLLATGNTHSITCYKPIYPGDTLYLTVDYRHFKDLTPPEGSEYRTFGLIAGGSVYNQRGELVNSLRFHVREHLKTWEDGKAPAEYSDWIGPPWFDREDHVYTDADWDFIRDVWSKEFIRGEEVLYWEDVKVGDEPAWTLDGPIDDTAEPIPFWGPGLGGSRTLKNEIMDPETFKTMKRNPYDGIYRLEKRSMSYPKIPEGLKITDKYGQDYDLMAHVSFAESDDPMSPPPERFVLINFMGRDFALRHFSNWMGNSGFIRNITWGIMNDATLENYGFKVTPSPDAIGFLDVLPDRKGTCRHHGLERDIALVKSRVFRKRVEDGEHLVDLAFWIETIKGDVYEEGWCTIVLPSRND